MSIKTVNSVIYSPCGGTGNVIDAMTQNLGRPVRRHDITLPGMRATDLEFSGDDFVFLVFRFVAAECP